MSGRLSPIEEVNLVAKVADLKLELERQIRTLDALIALLEDKGVLDAEQLQEKAWQLGRRSAAWREAAKARKPLPPFQSVPAFLRGRREASLGPGHPVGAGQRGFPGKAEADGRSGVTDTSGGDFGPAKR